MPQRSLSLLAALTVALASFGCDRGGDQTVRTRQPTYELPVYLRGTVSEHAVLVNRGGEMFVAGYGMVLGLGDKGASEVPAHLREYLVQQLAKNDVGSLNRGIPVSPEKILADRDTAVVMVAGSIPYGAPVGTRFDFNVRAVPGTSATSLDGGLVMPTEVRFAAGGVALPGRGSKIFAVVRGPVFVNPYLDPGDPNDQPKFTEGVILGGGRVVRDRPLRLELRDPDFAIANTIQKRINERFGNQKVAKAKSRSSIDIQVPKNWHDDYEHFLEVMMHVPLNNSGAQAEQHAREVVRQMELPGANHAQLSLVLEAMNRQILPLMRPLYGSRNDGAAFYSALAGVRLDDTMAGDTILRFAGKSGSPYQLPAIEELGRRADLLMGRNLLYKLLGDHDARVRVAAYEALVYRGDRGRIDRTLIEPGVVLDVVDVDADVPPVIYATRRLEQRIVIFGKDLEVQRPVFYNPADEMVTISGQVDQDELRVFRRVPRGGGYTPAFEIEPKVTALLELLAAQPELKDNGQYRGLGLTYGQVVRTLTYLTGEGYIPAKLILQDPGQVTTMQGVGGTVGRPEMPGQ